MSQEIQSPFMKVRRKEELGQEKFDLRRACGYDVEPKKDDIEWRLLSVLQEDRTAMRRLKMRRLKMRNTKKET